MGAQTVRAAVIGVAGRMGQRIISVIAGTEGITLAGALERPDHPLLGHEVYAPDGGGGTGIVLTDDLPSVLPHVDVVIDFSEAKSTLATIEPIAAHKKAVVIGTTGLSVLEMEQLQRRLEGLRSVVAPNMSIGVNLMFKVADIVGRVLRDDFDVEIVEAHHRMKKDAPSGTALRLARIVAESRGADIEEVGVYGRKGIVGEREAREIGIHAVRGGDIVGEHTVLFAGRGERFEITHRAHSRDTFAGGAVRAALWVVDQPPGMYGMEDVLGFRDRS
ncbi:MAG: 4-hydroxy-tetrahydrodipicolinate reductase [Deltaproteobacteria bacterium]|nr:4-hydroxy-tetrahydrodipicolinate reductase [Deltaproteobacteria bacterium]